MTEYWQSTGRKFCEICKVRLRCLFSLGRLFVLQTDLRFGMRTIKSQVSAMKWATNIKRWFSSVFEKVARKLPNRRKRLSPPNLIFNK